VAEKESIRATFQIEGMKETIQAFNKLDKDGKNAARDEVVKISQLLAERIRARAPADKRYQNLAVSVRAGRDRVPVIYIGGRATPRVSGGGGPRELVIGMEFGADQTGPNSWRFPARTPRQGRGNAGYWIYPTLKANQDDIIRLWFDAMDRIIEEWSE
jgi:hypothetical protein